MPAANLNLIKRESLESPNSGQSDYSSKPFILMKNKKTNVLNLKNVNLSYVLNNPCTQITLTRVPNEMQIHRITQHLP